MMMILPRILQYAYDGHDDDDEGGQHVQDGSAQVPNGHTRVRGKRSSSCSLPSSM